MHCTFCTVPVFNKDFIFEWTYKSPAVVDSRFGVWFWEYDFNIAILSRTVVVHGHAPCPMLHACNVKPRPCELFDIQFVLVLKVRAGIALFPLVRSLFNSSSRTKTYVMSYWSFSLTLEIVKPNFLAIYMLFILFLCIIP